MSEKKKTRVHFELEPTWNNDGWNVTINSIIPAETPQEALAMIISMYKLENPNDIDVRVSVRGNSAVDVLFGLEK